MPGRQYSIPGCGEGDALQLQVVGVVGLEDVAGAQRLGEGQIGAGVGNPAEVRLPDKAESNPDDKEDAHQGEENRTVGRGPGRGEAEAGTVVLLGAKSGSKERSAYSGEYIRSAGGAQKVAKWNCSDGRNPARGRLCIELCSSRAGSAFILVGRVKAFFLT